MPHHGSNTNSLQALDWSPVHPDLVPVVLRKVRLHPGEKCFVEVQILADISASKVRYSGNKVRLRFLFWPIEPVERYRMERKKLDF